MKTKPLGNKIINHIHPIGENKVETNLNELKDDFLKELKSCLEAINPRQKEISEVYLVDWLFREVINTEEEYRAYVKCNIKAAINFLEFIESQVKDKVKDIDRFANHIEELALDISWAIEYVQRIIKNNVNYKFFSGGKSRLDKTFVVFKSVEQNFWRSCHNNMKSKVRDDIQVSVSLLRKAIDKKFMYIVGIYDVYDKNFNKMKTKSDFYYNFINTNKDLIKVDHPSLKNVYKILNWASAELHSTRVPLVHVVYFAMTYVRPIFISKEKKDGSWNVNGSVEIENHREIMRRFSRVLDESKVWCIQEIKPDAVLV